MSFKNLCNCKENVRIYENVKISFIFRAIYEMSFKNLCNCKENVRIYEKCKENVKKCKEM
jgi:hypothetical protein